MQGAGKSGKAASNPAEAPPVASLEEATDALEATESLRPRKTRRKAAGVADDAAQSWPGDDGVAVKIGNRAFRTSTEKIGRKLDILPDLPDIRDRMYLPHLAALPAGVYPTVSFEVRDQGAESSCTGFALAHVIDFLLRRNGPPAKPPRMSSRMLYEMARLNDEWAGTAYDGSSIRGALRGFYRNGVCSEAAAPPPKSRKDVWALSYEMAKEARDTRLGAYLRLSPDLSDYHAAIAEIGVIYASAQIHTNWEQPRLMGGNRIKPGGDPLGGHAFAIVGYDQDGFWVLNSWGESWGDDGVAHWSYEDWASTIMDAWVLQLGVKAPMAFSAVPGATPSSATGLFGAPEPNRSDIVGHFVNVDDGRFVTAGRYASPSAIETRETVKRVTMSASNGQRGYDHLVIYAHGGLNALGDEARRIATWKRNDVFGRNKIYNFHLMWGSGFLDEAFGPLSQSQAGRASGIFTDLLFETGPGKAIGSYAWRNMKQDADACFNGAAGYDGGFVGLEPLLKGLDGDVERRPKLHLVGHSAGAIVLGRLLTALGRFKLKKLELAGIHLMAPACTTDFFNEHYGPYLKGKGALKLADKIYLYCLTDAQELADKVSIGAPPAYGRSLLYLVSRAYEDAPKTPLAGMQLFRDRLGASAKLQIDFSNEKSSPDKSVKTASTTHGGFDNDAATLTTVMTRILGARPQFPPKESELTGY